MSEHTPGPWIVEKTPELLYIGPPMKDAPAVVDHAVVAISLDGLKTAKLKSAALTNARLIAQAPRMLELLKGCRAFIHAELLCATFEEDLEEEVEEFEAMLLDIDSIIAKAEGREP